METLSKKDFENLCNNTELDPINMIDPDLMLDNILEILQFVNKPEMQNLRKKNYNQYETYISDKFKNFCENYPFIFYKVVKNEDLTPLLCMLKEIKMVKTGKCDFESAENRVVDGLLNKYVKKK